MDYNATKNTCQISGWINIKLKYWKVLYICQLPVEEQLI